MDSGSSATVGLFGLLMFVQFALVIVLLLGGIYVLYCLNRTASSLDRLATVAENWFRFQTYLEQQKQVAAQNEVAAPAPPAATPPAPEAPVAPVSWNQEPPAPVS